MRILYNIIVVMERSNNGSFSAKKGDKMERITQKHLESVLKRINAKAGFDNPKYSEIGSYTLDWAYGGVKLEKFVNDRGGISCITNGFNSKRETYNLMHSF